MPQFGYTQYFYDNTPNLLSREAWTELAHQSSGNLHATIFRIQQDLKDKFWDEHKSERIMLYFFIGGVITAPFTAGLGAFVAFILFIPLLSLLYAFVSHTKALHKQSQHLRELHNRARLYKTYEEYIQTETT